jgi:hypothetical protein
MNALAFTLHEVTSSQTMDLLRLHFQPQTKIPNKTTTGFVGAICRLTNSAQAPIPTEPLHRQLWSNPANVVRRTRPPSPSPPKKRLTSPASKVPSRPHQRKHIAHRAKRTRFRRTLLLSGERITTARSPSPNARVTETSLMRLSDAASRRVYKPCAT